MSQPILHPTVTLAKEEYVSSTRREDKWWPHDLSGIVGRHVVYTYGNGWTYELYYKNESKLDYKVLSGMVAGRCVKDQLIHVRQLAKGEMSYMVSWTEPTGTCVSQVLDLRKLEVHTVIFFPQWVLQNPHNTTGFQNENLEFILAHRDAGPTYPIHVVNESANIHFLEDSGPNDEQVIRPIAAADA